MKRLLFALALVFSAVPVLASDGPRIDPRAYSLYPPAELQTQVWHWVNGVLHGPAIIVDGTVTTTSVLAGDGSASAPSYSFTSEPGLGMYRAGSGQGVLAVGGNGLFGWTASSISLAGVMPLSWTSGGITAATDLSLSREAADHLFQRRTTNAQRASWANTYTSATNYESFSVDWQTTANQAIVGTRTAATGTGRVLMIGAQGDSGSAAWLALRSNPQSATPLSIGYYNASGTALNHSTFTSFLTLGEFTNTATSGTFNAIRVTPTYNQSSGTAANTDLLINRTPTAVGSGAQLLIDAQNNSVSKWSISNLGTETTTQTTLGNNVQVLQTTATNDDPVENVRQQRVTTTGATPTTIDTITIPASTTVGISCMVSNRRTGGVSGTAEDGAFYRIEVVMKNVAGTATEIAAETTTTIGESIAGYNVTAAPTGATELIQVTGATTTDITWHSTCRTYLVGS